MRNVRAARWSPATCLPVLAGCLCAMVLLAACRSGQAHDDSRLAFERAVALAQAKADALAETVDRAEAKSCRLTIELADDFSGEPLSGLIRVTNLETGKAVKLSEGFHRALNWYSLPPRATVRVPRTKVRVEALQGLEAARLEHVADLGSRSAATLKMTPRRFYDPRQRMWYAGNTHLHLMKLSRAEADRYLRVVPRSDNVDLVFLSHLRRLPDEKNYISNQIVEDSFQGDGLRRLSLDGLLFANGLEHRHNFGRGGEGYGHVMFLNLQKLIRPVSLGPGIMGSGTDGIPLRRGIRRAHDAGATVIWCHNSLGHEDLPNWANGLVHAQNIFDGGSRGSYEDSFYRYLNLGMRVPFSTGTDWFIYDFARVYVPVNGDLTAAEWLDGLRGGKSYITNGPFLEMETERAEIGDTLALTGSNQVTVVGRGLGRLDFKGLELVYNGKVVHRVSTKAEDGYYFADLRHGLVLDEPGWFALRIPLDAGKSELDRPLFAHTSPIYVELDGRRLFRSEVARDLIDEINESMTAIKKQATFANDAERQNVLSVYQAGIDTLEKRIRQFGD